MTHARPSSARSFRFLWSPNGASGPITFQIAVVSTYDYSYMANVCLPDDVDIEVARASRSGGEPLLWSQPETW